MLQTCNFLSGEDMGEEKHGVETIPVPLFQSCLAMDNDHASHYDGRLTQTKKQNI